MSPERLNYIMKIVNVCNAILLVFTGIWVFFSHDLTVLVVLAACYVIVFSLILFSWEIHFEMCDVFYLRNMGFMFSWSGRLFFFIFVATLAFGLGQAGLAIGIITFINAAWNVMVVCTHPEYFNFLRGHAEDQLKKAMIAEAAKITGVVGVAKDIQDIGGVGDLEAGMDDKKLESFHQPAFMPPPKPPAAADDLPAGWEMRTDETSGEPYYVNSLNGEVSWTKPE